MSRGRLWYASKLRPTRDVAPQSVWATFESMAESLRGGIEDRPDYDYADGVIFHLSEPESGRAALGCVPAPDGSVALTAKVRREGDRIDVQMD